MAGVDDMPYPFSTMKKILIAIAACIYALTAVALADSGPSYAGAASASEAAFVRGIQSDLEARFPTAADAVKAGYVRYTNADDTGAISYANLQWQSADPQHPSQLWYDKNGKLLGADFSRFKTGATPPSLWGINPGRWSEFDGHVHWVGKDPATGALTYDHWVMQPAWVAAGGSVRNPSAVTLVKLGKVTSPADVATIFFFPTVWDLIVWVKPNPNGAFADKNPTVTP
jgi:hypothetical protein